MTLLKAMSSLFNLCFMIIFRAFIFCFLFFVCAKLNAAIDKDSEMIFINNADKIIINTTDCELIQVAKFKSPNRVLLKLRSRLKNSKKITAAVLAFPLPFGIVGLHRIYLGTKAYVPVVYISTVGGCFGILPMIDFFVILFDKDTEQFVNNPHVFMWAK
jgi:TM2 domain-containing membrane protein YozV